MHRFPRLGIPAAAALADRRRIRAVALVAGVASIGFGGLYLAGLLTSGDDIPAGARVQGVDVGGLSRQQAQEKLDRQLGAA